MGYLRPFRLEGRMHKNRCIVLHAVATRCILLQFVAKCCIALHHVTNCYALLHRVTADDTM